VLSAIKMKHILVYISFFLFSYQSYSQLSYTDEKGKSYRINKIVSDYTIGVILFESYKYTDSSEYIDNRNLGLKNIKSSADLGYAPAQNCLGNLYLTDPILKNEKIGLELLKKAAFQLDQRAIQSLERLGVDYKTLPIYKRISKLNISLILLLLGHITLASFGHSKINKSRFMTNNRKKSTRYINWLLPIFGSVYSIHYSKRLIKPLDQESMEWIKEAIDWLVYEFGIESKNIPLFKPNKETFNIKFDGSEKSGFNTVSFLASKMGLDPHKIKLSFFDESYQELGNGIITQSANENDTSVGLYLGKNKDGKFEIALERTQLNQHENMVSTLAHEISHILLIGQKRTIKNDEFLTDLVPIIFGFGIFSANSAFRFNQGNDRWSLSRQGYLNQEMWGFALAYAYAHKEENEQNDIEDYLSISVAEYYDRSRIYLKSEKADNNG
jgi:hypothetical protein